eukprot:s145_g11.t1
MAKLGMKRCKTDANLYCHEVCPVLRVCGDDPLIDEFIKKLSEEVLLKVEGHLTPGTSATFLGRTLRRNGDSIDISISGEYVDKMLDMYGMKNCEPVQTTGSTTTKMTEFPQPLGTAEHKLFRAAVGKLSYSTKELSRDVTAPTEESVQKLKHLLRYVSGIKGLVQRLSPGMTLNGPGCNLDLNCYVDSDWARCKRTRKSTLGTVIQLLECTVASGSRTQGTIALSSGKAELYAIGQRISETLYVRNLLLEANFAKTVKINVHIDSTGKIASRFGAGKKSKHIELRYLYMQKLVQRGVLTVRKVVSAAQRQQQSAQSAQSARRQLVQRQ